MELRYMGFDQHDTTRVYKFDGLENGQTIVQSRLHQSRTKKVPCPRC
jgi:hypothetical protein